MKLETRTNHGRAGDYVAQVVNDETGRLLLFARLIERLVQRIEEDAKILTYDRGAACFIFNSPEVYRQRMEKNKITLERLFARINNTARGLAVSVSVGGSSLLKEKPNTVAL
jgi:hypothetical protein